MEKWFERMYRKLVFTIVFLLVFVVMPSLPFGGCISSDVRIKKSDHLNLPEFGYLYRFSKQEHTQVCLPGRCRADSQNYPCFEPEDYELKVCLKGSLENEQRVYEYMLLIRKLSLSCPDYR